MEKDNDLNSAEKQLNNPLHGVRLADILDYLVKKHPGLAEALESLHLRLP